MNKILGVRWFTDRAGTSGIVRVETEFDGIVYYLGFVGRGTTEDEDCQVIADWGAKFPLDAGNTLFGIK